MIHTIAGRDTGYLYEVRSVVVLPHSAKPEAAPLFSVSDGVSEVLGDLRSRGVVTDTEQVFDERYHVLAREREEAWGLSLESTGEPSPPPPDLVTVDIAEGVDPREVVEELAERTDLFERAWLPSPRYPCNDLTGSTTDPLRASQWALDRIRLAEAREHPRFAEPRDRRITIVDTGIERRHPDLEGIQYLNLLTREPDFDYHGHGTAIAGVIGATRGNGKGIEGICEAESTVLKAFPWSRIAPWNAKAFYRALGMAAETPSSHVVNLSFAGTAWDQGETDLIDRLIEAGVIVVVAMGNEGEKGNPVLLPAGLALDRDVVAVAAVDQHDQPCAFSCRGPHVTVAAPGFEIPTSVPSHSNHYSESQTGYDSLSGTSFAAAIVSASLAIALAADVIEGPESAKRLLERRAVPIAGQGSGEHLDTVGFGVIEIPALLDN